MSTLFSIEGGRIDVVKVDRHHTPAPHEIGLVYLPPDKPTRVAVVDRRRMEMIEEIPAISSEQCMPLVLDAIERVIAHHGRALVDSGTLPECGLFDWLQKRWRATPEARKWRRAL